MALEHLNDSEYEALKSQGLVGLNDEAYDRYKLPKGYGIPKTKSQETYPEEQYKNQNPEVRSLETAQKMVESAVPEPVKKGAEMLGRGVSAASRAIQKPFDYARSIPGLKEATILTQPLGLGGLFAAADAGKVIHEGGKMMVKRGEESAEAGSVALGSAQAGLGGLAQMVPAQESDIILSAIPVEKAVAPSAKFALGATDELGKMVQVAAEFLPGSSLVVDAFKAGKVAVKENLAFKRRVSKLSKQLTYVGDKVADMESGFKPVADAITYGEFAKKGLEFQEQLSKAPLIAAVDDLASKKSMKALSSVEDIGLEAGTIANELTGVIETAKDTTVTKIINKYLGQKQDATDIFIFDSEKGSFKRAKGAPPPEYVEASVSDLLKDRSRIGEAIEKSKRSGVLYTEQSTALIKLQDVIDSGIERRLVNDAPALKQMQEIRAGWRRHYDKYASDTAITIKSSNASDVISKIGRTASGVEEARNILPTAVFEKIAQDEAYGLLNKMNKAKNASQALSDELIAGKGYYERLLGQNQVASMKTLAAHKVDAKGMLDEMTGLGEEIEKTFGKNRRKNASILDNLKRATDTGKIARQASVVGSLELAAATLLLSGNAKMAALFGAIGLAPGAVALAYYAGGRALRASFEKALIRTMRLGKAANSKDIRLMQSITVAGSLSAKNKQEEIKTQSFKRINDFFKKPSPPKEETKTTIGNDGLGRILGDVDPEPAEEDYFEAQ